MFKGSDGNFSTTKIMSFLGFLVFLVVSVICVFYCPDKFDYRVFAILSASSSAGMKCLDKYMNIMDSKKE